MDYIRDDGDKLHERRSARDWLLLGPHSTHLISTGVVGSRASFLFPLWKWAGGGTACMVWYGW